ncbi:MAG: hypothetical protein WC564_03700 [Patescibacteria group bacterium]
MNSDSLFKFFFGLAVFVFCLVVIGIFLVLLKIILLFTPEIHLMGLNILQ